MLIIGLIITGLVITLGGGPDGKRKGFQYWKNPGAIARAGLVDNVDTDKFLAIMSVIVQAAFSFQSMELVAMYALGRVSRVGGHITDPPILHPLVPLPRLRVQGGTSPRLSRGSSGVFLSSTCETCLRIPIQSIILFVDSRCSDHRDACAL